MYIYLKKQYIIKQVALPQFKLINNYKKDQVCNLINNKGKINLQLNYNIKSF